MSSDTRLDKLSHRFVKIQLIVFKMSNLAFNHTTAMCFRHQGMATSGNDLEKYFKIMKQISKIRSIILGKTKFPINKSYFNYIRVQGTLVFQA